MSVKHCARCDKRLPAEADRIYSRFTHSYYCANLNTCGKRARRLKRTKVTA